MKKTIIGQVIEDKGAIWPEWSEQASVELTVEQSLEGVRERARAKALSQESARCLKGDNGEMSWESSGLGPWNLAGHARTLPHHAHKLSLKEMNPC